jgi:indole-3-acetate monooxygenase
VYETWEDMQDTLRREEKPSVRQNTLIRLATVQVTAAAHEVAAFGYKAAGTTALRAGVIQRLFRDMHAGTQHVIVSPPVLRALGRELAGLAAGQQWRFLELV